MRMTFEDVADFATGAGILGTGGGGDPYLGRLMLEQAFVDNHDVRILDLDELPDDSMVMCLGMMGAPSVMVEKLPNGIEAENCVKAVERYMGRRVDAIMPAEIGGINALLPLASAARLGRPVVNCDGMGRAFPEVQMITYNICGHPAAPVAMADEYGSSVVIDGESALICERLSRHMVAEMGATCFLGAYVMTGAQLKTACVPGTLEIALNIGRTIRAARRSDTGAADALVQYLRQTPFYRYAAFAGEGKVVDLQRRTEDGFTIGEVRIEALSASEGGARHLYDVAFRNEYLTLQIDGRIATMVPDLICILDRETLDPINTEALRYGQRVRIMVASAPDILRSDTGLTCVGPRCFGLDHDFTPVEQLLALQA